MADQWESTLGAGEQWESTTGHAAVIPGMEKLGALPGPAPNVNAIASDAAHPGQAARRDRMERAPGESRLSSVKRRLGGSFSELEKQEQASKQPFLRMGQGVSQMRHATNRGEAAGGASEVIRGGLGVAAQAAPFHVAMNPIPAVAGVLAGEGASAATENTARAFGASPGTSALSGDVVGGITGLLTGGLMERGPVGKVPGFGTRYSNSPTMKERLLDKNVWGAVTDLIPGLGPSTGYKAKIAKVGKALWNAKAPERLAADPATLDPYTSPGPARDPYAPRPELPPPPEPIPQQGAPRGDPQFYSQQGPMEYGNAPTPRAPRAAREPKPAKPKAPTKAEREANKLAVERMHQPAPVNDPYSTVRPPTLEPPPRAEGVGAGPMEYGGPPIKPLPVEELPMPRPSFMNDPFLENPSYGWQPSTPAPPTERPVGPGVGAGGMEYGAPPPRRGAPAAGKEAPGDYYAKPQPEPAPEQQGTEAGPDPWEVARILFEETKKAQAAAEEAKAKGGGPEGGTVHPPGTAHLPPIESLPLHYAGHRAKVGDIGALDAFAKDLQIAKHLQSQNITPEIWESMDVTAKNNAIVGTPRNAGQRPIRPFAEAPPGGRSRGLEGLDHVGETLRWLYSQR